MRLSQAISGEIVLERLIEVCFEWVLSRRGRNAVC